MPSPRLAELLKLYPWQPHPEGMLYLETHRDDLRTVAICLFLPGTGSAPHRVTSSSELWFLHEGELDLHVLTAPGAPPKTHRLSLGQDGGLPTFEVPRNLWQAATLPHPDSYALCSVVCAPPFHFSNFETAPEALFAAGRLW
jgi:predicted cupin superfamily sugar epimerase